MLFGCVFLTCVAADVDPLYSIVSPMVHTGIGEIKNWTLRGQAVSTKKVLHLTSGYAGSYGGICSRIPTASEDWVGDLELSITGDIFIMAFSDHVCPNVLDYFAGVNVTFSKRGDSEYVVKIDGDEVFSDDEGVLNVQETASKVHIRIYKENSTMRLVTAENGQTFLKTKLPSRYAFGYLSFHAYTPLGSSNSVTDLYGFRFFPLGGRQNVVSPDLDHRNRKYLSTSSSSRLMMKMVRRASMLMVSRYIEQSSEADDELYHEEVNLQDALTELSEVVQRARQGISNEYLQVVIKNQIYPVLEKASARYERVADALWHMKSELLSLWSDVKKDLSIMNSNITMTCNQLKSDAMDLAIQLLPHKSDVKTPEVPPDSSLNRLLFRVFIIELIGYVVFFIRQRNRVSRRKYM